MSNGNSSNSNKPGLDNILTALQQGVVAINNLTKSISSIFPSSS